MMRLFCFIWFLHFGSSLNNAEIHVQEIFSLEYPTWITNSGMSRGKGHDHQDIGYLLKKNTVLQIRQVNPEFKNTIKVRLIGNDNTADQNYEVKSEWTTITAERDLVPFVDTPSGSINATIEFTVGDGAERLLVYEHGLNESKFFDAWNKQHAYVLVKNFFFQLLIPNSDYQIVKNLTRYGFASVDDLIVHYEKIFKYYNDLAGLDNTSPTDRLNTHRYFLRADKSGVGAAYYGELWTANSEASTMMWLQRESWGCLHEIGHGYQPAFNGMEVGEVTNNLFAVYFNFFDKGRKFYKGKWVRVDELSKEENENKFYKDMEDCKNDYAQLDVFNKLALLVTMTEAAGVKALTKLYKAHRMAANNKDTLFEQRLPELLNRHYSDHSLYDFAPVLEQMELKVDFKESLQNRIKGYRPIAALKHVVPKKYISNARARIDHNRTFTTDYQLVSNDEISFLGLRGELVIFLEKNEYMDTFDGIQITIKDGNRIVARNTFKNSCNYLKFSNISIGIYSLEFRGIKSVVPTSNYIYIKNSFNIVSIGFKISNVNSLSAQKITFFGIFASEEIAKLTYDFTNNIAVFEVLKTNPDYNENIYMYIKVKNLDGLVKYEKEIRGKGENKTSHIIYFEQNDIIDIFLKEPRKVKGNDVFINKKSNLNRFLVTKYGLQNLAFTNDPESNFASKIYNLSKLISLHDESNTITKLDKQELIDAYFLLEQQYRRPLEPFIQKHCNCSITELQSEINNFKGLRNTKTYFFEQRKSIFSQNVFKKFPEILGNQTSIKFLGFNDDIIAKLTIDSSENTAVFEITKDEPHVFFPNSIYMSIKVMDTQNKIKLEKEIKGTDKSKGLWSITLQINDTIKIFHQELSTRVKSDNIEINKANHLNVFCLTEYGLKNLGINVDPQFNIALQIYKLGQIILSDTKLNDVPLEISTEKQRFIDVSLSLEKQYRNYLDPLIEYFCKDSFAQLINYFKAIEYKHVKNYSKVYTTGIAFDIISTGLKKYVPRYLRNQTIMFLGYGDSQIAKFTIDIFENNAVFEIFSSRPHEFFKNSIYMSINIIGSDGKIKYSKSIHGKKENITIDRFSLKINDTVEIFHKETSSRVKSGDTEINKKNQLNTFIVTKSGLRNLNSDENVQYKFILKVYRFGQSILTDEKMNQLPIEFCPEKQAFINFITLLEDQFIESFVPNYESLYDSSLKITNVRKSRNLSATNLVSYVTFKNHIYSQEYVNNAKQRNNMHGLRNQTITFLGLGDGEIARFTKDITEDSAFLEVFTTKPHFYFNYDIYMYIKIFDPYGLLKYEKLLKGRGENILTQELPLKLYDIVEIYHQEMSRVISDDVDFNIKKQLNTFRVTKYGLQNLYYNKDPQLTFAFKLYKFGNLLLSNREFDSIPFELSLEKQDFVNSVLLLREQHFKSLVLLVKNICKCSFTQLLNDIYSYEFRTKKHFNYFLAKERIVNFRKDFMFASFIVSDYNPKALRNQTIEFLGIGDARIASFSKDFSKKSAVFEVFLTNPHPYFDLYMSIKVTDPSGKNIKYERNVHGIKENITSETFHVEINDLVEIHHKEIKRVKSDDIDTNISKDLKYTVTKFGLQNLASNIDPKLKFISKLNRFGKSLISDKELKAIPLEFSHDKQAFINLVGLLEQQERKSFIPIVETICDNCSLDEVLKYLGLETKDTNSIENI